MQRGCVPAGHGTCTLAHPKAEGLLAGVLAMPRMRGAEPTERAGPIRAGRRDGLTSKAAFRIEVSGLGRGSGPSKDSGCTEDFD